MSLDDHAREFVDESNRLLTEVDRELVELEAAPDAGEDVDDLFRRVHTVKGNCGFFGYSRLQSIMHSAENLLSFVRDGHLELNEEIVGALLTAVDTGREILREIAESGEEPEKRYGSVIAELEQLQRLSVQSGSDDGSEAEGSDVENELDAAAERESRPEGGERSHQRAEEPSEPSGGSDAGDSAGPAEGAEERAGGLQQGTIRVDVELLDELMSQISELILTRNQMERELGALETEKGVEGAFKQLDLVTGQLQESIMEARMQPIGRLWSRFPRLVRDLGREYDKEVRLETSGGETELDRHLIEKIADPLTHLVRNAVDHGIESPEERNRAGKPETGTIWLEATQERGQVVIRVADDGRGLDLEAIENRVREWHLLDAEELETASPEQLQRLLFEPGFSTTEEVTDVSGRGVGLDVVKENIEEAGGHIELESAPGEGTVFELYLPLTLAVMSSLTVRSAGRRFVLPLENVVRLAKIRRGNDENRLDFIHDTPVFHFRGRVLPVVFLDRVLGLEERAASGRGVAGQPQNVVVLEANRTLFAMVVDGIDDTEELVVKSLGQILGAMEIYTGATVRGDGRAEMILDPNGILRRASLGIEEEETSELFDDERAEPEDGAEEEPEQLDEILWCRSRDDGRMAIPLESIERLEQISRKDVDHVGDIQYFDYRGSLVPVLSVEDLLPERRSEPRNEEVYEEAVDADEVSMVVYRHGDRRVGLILTEFLEILEADLSDQRGVSRPGVAFCTKIRDQITEVIDVQVLVEEHLGDDRREG